MGLTPAERKEFTAGQLTELDRMSEGRLDGIIEPDGTHTTPEARAKSVAKLADLNRPGEMRTRVNILTVKWGFNRDTGRDAEVAYAPESNYTVAEKTKITLGIRPPWNYVIPHLLK